MRKVTFQVVSFLTIVALLTGCSSNKGSNPPNVSSSAVNGPCIMPPQTDGKIQSIQEGNHSYVTLSDVTIIDKNQVKTQESTLRVELPKGHFISKNHWQSSGDTLDLFIGDDSILENGHITDITTYDDHFDGLVKSVSPHQIMIQKVIYDEESQGMKITNETATIKLKPYTYVSLNGMTRVKNSEIKKGDALILILIGTPDDYIATQITDFHKISDIWDVVK